MTATNVQDTTSLEQNDGSLRALRFSSDEVRVTPVLRMIALNVHELIAVRIADLSHNSAVLTKPTFGVRKHVF